MQQEKRTEHHGSNKFLFSLPTAVYEEPPDETNLNLLSNASNDNVDKVAAVSDCVGSHSVTHRHNALPVHLQQPVANLQPPVVVRRRARHNVRNVHRSVVSSNRHVHPARNAKPKPAVLALQSHVQQNLRRLAREKLFRQPRHHKLDAVALLQGPVKARVIFF